TPAAFFGSTRPSTTEHGHEDGHEDDYPVEGPTVATPPEGGDPEDRQDAPGDSGDTADSGSAGGDEQDSESQEAAATGHDRATEPDGAQDGAAGGGETDARSVVDDEVTAEEAPPRAEAEGAQPAAADEETPAADGPAQGSPGVEDDTTEDRRTAVFRAVTPGTADAGDGKVEPLPSEREDHPTTAIRVSRSAELGGKPEPGAEPGAGDRGTSRFVPLRPTDGSREAGGTVSRPLPDEETTGTTTPAAVITGVGGEQERTKQQPVPEPPPLELLAQLTNTPPPPATPVRTAVRRMKIWTPLVVLLALVFVVVQAVRPLPEPTLTLTEQATHTFDGGEPTLPWPGTGQAYVEVSGLGVLGSSGEQKPVPIGSVAKTMTAYLVLEKFPLKEGEDGPKITIDQQAEDGGNRGAGNGDESVLPSVEKGDEISERDALSALMIPSANNIARLLARWHSGSEAAFVEKMNETAQELGMENTDYTDPSGLKESTVSTAEDQVKLGKKAMEAPALVAITSLPFWKDPFSGDRMRNWNTLVSSTNAIGIKTGTTTAAGGNLLFAGRKEVGGTQQLIVGAVLGQHKPPIIDTVNAVSGELLDAARGTLISEKIVQKGDVVGYLDDGLGGRTPVVATKDVAAVGWGGVEVDLALEPAKKMPHTAPPGTKVGTLTVGGGPGQVEVPVALEKNLTEPAFGDKLTRVL
ncbi:hypothetical protein N566_01750, partial [Streptomycetaceae bacterium MP113-05]